MHLQELNLQLLSVNWMPSYALGSFYSYFMDFAVIIALGHRNYNSSHLITYSNPDLILVHWALYIVNLVQCKCP